MFRVEDELNRLEKHRDYQHSTFAEHEFDNGATRNLLFPVWCDVNPVTERELNPSQKYFIVSVTLHGGQEYWYLVPAEADGSEPNLTTLMKTMNDYASNPVPGGRNEYDYIDVEKTKEEYQDILANRYAGRLIN
jgi:hypothetical protein